eukprot:2122495-Prymnesium_polylepis.1
MRRREAGGALPVRAADDKVGVPAGPATRCEIAVGGAVAVERRDLAGHLRRRPEPVGRPERDGARVKVPLPHRVDLLVAASNANQCAATRDQSEREAARSDRPRLPRHHVRRPPLSVARDDRWRAGRVELQRDGARAERWLATGRRVDRLCAQVDDHQEVDAAHILRPEGADEQHVVHRDHGQIARRTRRVVAEGAIVARIGRICLAANAHMRRRRAADGPD